MAARFEISSQVQKLLREKDLRADDVLREALNVKPEGFTSHGVFFPEGTVFVAWYKERALSCVVKNGTLRVGDGKEYNSLSAAAAHFTGRPTTNGWQFWNARFPGKEGFVPLAKAS